jgi:3-oxoacyl-[acyl-carrier-protein] synthase-1
MNQWTTSLTSSNPGIEIVGLGAATPVGRTVWATAAAVRAGISGFAQHSYMVDATGAKVSVAPMPWLDESRGIVERIGDALVASIREVLAPLEVHGPRSPIALLVNLPSPRPGLPAGLTQRIDERLRHSFTGVFERRVVATLGHAGGLIALRSALQLIVSAPHTMVLVAGADSYLDPDVLEWLEEIDQLHGAGERNNAWGFVPGEGAGASLLASTQVARSLGLSSLGRVYGVGVGREAKLIGTGEVCLGLGLTDAVRGALAALPVGARLTDVYCDMNGDPYRADEFAFMVMRSRERFVAASDFVAPADCWGDVGAASAPLSIALACVAGAKGYAKGSVALVWASSVGGERGAAVIETTGPCVA